MASHHALLARLNLQSVKKHHDAYADIAWEPIDPTDPRFERPGGHGLGRTAWYRALPAASRARMGLHLAMTQMRIGIEFESVLMRGLLEFASLQPMGSPELRYAFHEIIEESQHTLMFQEMIARSGLPVRGLSGFEAFGARRVPKLARTFPELFFLHVLGGEAPIDHAQKTELARGDQVHPLLRRVMRIHVIEEARHIAFAASFLRDRVPRLSPWKMLQLRVATPITLAAMARQMLEPPRWLLDLYAVPNEVRREAFRDDPVHRRQIADGLSTLRELCCEIGIVTPKLQPLWRALGIWDAPHQALLTA
ncbi:MAG: AurF N-oxygenase family protein [Polyangiales bacterium]